MLVYVYAHREDAHDHQAYRGWLESVVNADSAFGLSDLVLVVSGFVRIVTHPQIFMPPSPLAKAMRFAEELRSRPNRVAVTPGRDHWRIFRRLCDESGAKGNLVPDAFLAAMAIEHGCEWITTGRRLRPLFRSEVASPAEVVRRSKPKPSLDVGWTTAVNVIAPAVTCPRR